MRPLLHHTHTRSGLDYHPAHTDPHTFIDRLHLLRNFVAMKAHPYFQYLMVSAAYFPDGPKGTGFRTFWAVYQALNFNLLMQERVCNLYYSTVAMYPNASLTNMQIWYPHQTTGANFIPMQNTNAPPAAFHVLNGGSGWADDTSFNQYSGQVEVNAWQWMQAANTSWLQVVRRGRGGGAGGQGRAVVSGPGHGVGWRGHASAPATVAVRGAEWQNCPLLHRGLR